MATLGGICAAPRGRKHSDLVRVGILPPKSLLPSTLSPVIECPVWRRQCALQSPRHRFSSFKLQVACMSDAHEAAKNSGRGEIDTAGAVSQIIAKQLTIDPSTVKPDSKLRELGVDSLDTVHHHFIDATLFGTRDLNWYIFLRYHQVEIMMSIEDHFNISLPEEGAEKVTTVQEAVNLIEKVTPK